MYEMETDDSNVFYRNVRRSHPVLIRGEGVYVWDRNGTRYLDGCSGALVSNIGHGVKDVARAIAAQAERLAFAHGGAFSSLPAISLARRLAGCAPGSLNKVYFVSGGSEATESALKLARQYHLEMDKNTHRHKVISRWHSYHGNTLGALSMSGHLRRRRLYEPLLLDFPHIPPPYCYRCSYGLTYPGCDLRCARALEDAILMEGPDNVAAFIAETVVGAAAGALVPPGEYYQVIRQICDKYHVLFIADEVMCGAGRTGKYFAVEHWGVTPDVIVCAKGLGAGYAPLGAMIVRDEIWEVFRKGSGMFVHGHTYGGNPLACAAGCAVLDFIEENGLVENAAVMGDYVKSRMTELMSIPIVGDVRGIGLMIGVEIVRDQGAREEFDAALGVAEMVAGSCMRRGVAIYPGQGCADGVSGDQFLVGPPLTLCRSEADEMVDGIAAGLREVAGRLLERNGRD